MAGHLP
jgi:hypothetical protein